MLTYHQCFLLLRRAESIRDENNSRVQEVADEHSRGNDFNIGVFLFVQIPSAADTEELTPVSCAV